MYRLLQREAAAWYAGITLIAVLSACLLLASGCGGGGGDTEDSPSPAQAAGVDAALQVAWVQLEGCVVDEFYIPRTGAPVRALSIDDRLLGSAVSGQDGAVKLRVPAHQAMTLAIDLRDGKRMPVSTGSGKPVGACLRDPTP